MWMRTVALGLAASAFWLSPRVTAQEIDAEETRVTIQSDGWTLVGDFRLPLEPAPVPAVLMLNHAARDRTDYARLADLLARRGVASLRLDLRGHGESLNLGRFVPGEREHNPLIWDAEADVAAGIEYLRSDPRVDGARLGVVGASYSGEEMAEAGRLGGYERAYVALSPGSFSDESIGAIDTSGVAWLFVVSRDERHLGAITAAVRDESRSVELVVLPGTEHGARILVARTDLAERIAVWLAARLHE